MLKIKMIIFKETKNLIKIAKIDLFSVTHTSTPFNFSLM